MSADAYVSSSRLRPPSNLSSSVLPNRRNAAHHRQFFSTTSSAYRSWRGGEEREGDPALSGAQVDSDSYEQQADGGIGNIVAGEMQDVPDWIDMDRYEDWDRPTLESLCPNIRIPFEDDLFPIAVAEDGESLPSEIHPSHPYGNLHQQTLSYTSRPKLPPRRGIRYQPAEEFGGKDGMTDSIGIPPHIPLRARQTVAPNAPTWPFRRFGPGPGGPNALERAESTRYWRPYKAVWADLGLEELLPTGVKVKEEMLRRESDNERADLPQKGDDLLPTDSSVQMIMQELEDFDAAHLESGEEEARMKEKIKSRRRMQPEWKWGQPRVEG